MNWGMGPIYFCCAVPMKTSKDLNRAMASKEYRAATSSGERGLLLSMDFDIDKKLLFDKKICTRSTLRRATESNALGFRLGHSGNRFKLSLEDENQIAQYIKMLINDTVPVYLDDVQSLVFRTVSSFFLSFLFRPNQ